MQLRKRISELIEGKEILILGFGREGKSTYRFLRGLFPTLKLTIADKQLDINRFENAIELQRDKNLSFKLGKKYLDNISGFNMIFKTPGIPLDKLSQEIPARNITSQTDIFLKLFSSQIIGITGTKGKSTTSSLIHHIIKTYTKNTLLVGNIGIPPFDTVFEIDCKTRIVYELSCHQLSHIAKSPHISIILNIYQEHLDYYKTFEEYQLAKYNIALYQKSDDYLIFNSESQLISNLISRYYARKKYFSFSLNNKTENGCYITNRKIYFTNEGKNNEVYDLKQKHYLRGKHNLLNIMAAIIACRAQGISFTNIRKGISTFKGLKHRLEYIGNYYGIKYYNDSIATIPEATIEAVKTLEKVDTLILGGYDRGIDYSLLIEFIIESNISNVLLLGNAGKRILREIKKVGYNLGRKKMILVIDMEEAVKIAKTETAKEKICLLSPAASSYDMFRDFAHRGETFVKLVKKN